MNYLNARTGRCTLPCFLRGTCVVSGALQMFDRIEDSAAKFVVRIVLQLGDGDAEIMSAACWKNGPLSNLKAIQRRGVPLNQATPTK